MSTVANIVKTPDVLHGKPRIEGSRVGVLQVGELVRTGGWSVQEVMDEFDLERDEVDGALQYYDDHRDEMETLRAQREANLERVRRRSRDE